MSDNRHASDSRKTVYICIGLVFATFLVFWEVQYYDFVSFDDAKYVYDNDDVLAGLTWPAIVETFTTPYFANWHPLTTLSFMANAEFFGTGPRGFHSVNLFLHILNTVLMFLVFKSLTGTVWRSAAVAALFALHPYHVEPVAWISSRKDVLSATFWIAAIGAYARFAEKPSRRRMVAVCILFGCALMSKPIAVTFPFVLLLLDFWPLNRYGENREITFERARKLVVEKVPLFIMTAVSIPITMYAASVGNAVRDLDQVALLTRFENVPLAYLLYILKMFVPVQLIPGGYITPTDTPIWQTAGALFAVVAITAAVIVWRRKLPYLPVGWLWFVGMLVPVIGVISIGSTLRTDRYTYLSIVGLFVILAWGVPELFRKLKIGDIAARAVAAIAITACAAMTWLQLDYWRDSMSMWSRMLELNPTHPQAHYNVGLLHAKDKQFLKAIPFLAESLEVRPNDPQTMLVLSSSLFAIGKVEDAEEVIRAAVAIRPDYSLGHFHLVNLLKAVGKLDEAEAALEEVIRLQPENDEAKKQLEALRRQRAG